MSLYRWLRGVDGMGWGDVKYLSAIGAVVGLQGCLMVLVVAAILGALVGGFLIVIGRGSGKTALPFGTFLALAVILCGFLWKRANGIGALSGFLCGVAMSIRRKLMPSCRRATSELVRTRQKIQSAWWASVVQVLVPLTM